MRNIKKDIPTKAFKYVAQKVINKFPETFKDIDSGGTIIGDGSHSLVCKLVDRNNYLNRPHKTGSFSKVTSPSLQKRKLNCKTGCTQWQPQTLNRENLEPEIEKLRTCDEIDENYYILLENTYVKQREFLNNIEDPTICEKNKTRVAYYI